MGNVFVLMCDFNRKWLKNLYVSCVQKLYDVLLSFFIVLLRFFYKRDQDCILSGSLYSRKLLVAIGR